MNSTRLSRKSSSSKSTVISSPIFSPHSPLSPSASNSTVASSFALTSSFHTSPLPSSTTNNALHHHASSPSLNFTSDHQVISSLTRSFDNHHPLPNKANLACTMPREPCGHPTLVSLPHAPSPPSRRPHPIVPSQPIHHALRATFSHSQPPTPMPSQPSHGRSPSPPPSQPAGASRLRTVRTKILRSLTPTSLATRPTSPDLTRSPATSLGELPHPPRRASLRALCSRTPTPVARPATALANPLPNTPLYDAPAPPPPPAGRWKLLGGLRKRAPAPRWPPTPPPSTSRRSSSGSTGGESRPPRVLRPCSKSLTNMWFEAQQTHTGREQPEEEPTQHDEPEAMEEDNLAHAASQAAKHWRRRQSPTEIALGRLDEILRGHHESVAESMTVARMVEGRAEQEEEETQRRTDAKDHRLTYYALSPPQRPRKKTTAKPFVGGIHDGTMGGQSGMEADAGAETHTQSQTQAHKKVVIEPKMWEKISISASEHNRNSGATTTVGPARRCRGGLVGWPAMDGQQQVEGTGGGGCEEEMKGSSNNLKLSGGSGRKSQHHSSNSSNRSSQSSRNSVVIDQENRQDQNHEGFF